MVRTGTEFQSGPGTARLVGWPIYHRRPSLAPEHVSSIEAKMSNASEHISVWVIGPTSLGPLDDVF